jgi:hypothetical protein
MAYVPLQYRRSLYLVEGVFEVDRIGDFARFSPGFWKSVVYSCFLGYSDLSLVPVLAHIILTLCQKVRCCYFVHVM